MEPEPLTCPGCGRALDPGRHGDLVCDGEVWCDRCRAYDRELLRPREFPEIQAWARLICLAFGVEPVPIEENSDPARFRKEATVVTAEADHRERSILIYSPGCRLATLCHELAHLITGEDHTSRWAVTFARLVAWVRERLEKNEGPPGWPATVSVCPVPPFTVKR